MIEDKDVDEAVHWLMNSADIIATAKATLVYLEEYRKSLRPSSSRGGKRKTRKLKKNNRKRKIKLKK